MEEPGAVKITGCLGVQGASGRLHQAWGFTVRFEELVKGKL